MGFLRASTKGIQPRPDLYKSHVFRAVKVQKQGKNGRKVQGMVSWTMGGAWDPTRAEKHVVTWDQIGYKIGLRIRKNQTVRVQYRSERGGKPVLLCEDEKVTMELRRHFSAVAGERWIGLVPAQPGQRRWHKFEPPNQIHFQVELDITPADARYQVIPYVGRYPNRGFEDGHISGSWEVPGKG